MCIPQGDMGTSTYSCHQCMRQQAQLGLGHRAAAVIDVVIIIVIYDRVGNFVCNLPEMFLCLLECPGTRLHLTSLIGTLLHSFVPDCTHWHDPTIAHACQHMPEPACVHLPWLLCPSLSVQTCSNGFSEIHICSNHRLNPMFGSNWGWDFEPDVGQVQKSSRLNLGSEPNCSSTTSGIAQC